MPFQGLIDPSDSPTLTINGNDYTLFIGPDGFDIQQSLPAIPRADERRPKFEPVIAIGSINFFADQERLVIDWEAAIAGDFKEGRPIVITTKHNTYRFRVRNWDVTEQDPCTGQIRGIAINITDRLGQINRQTTQPPFGDFIDLLNSEQINPAAPILLWQKVIRLIGQFPRKADDQPYLSASDFDLPTDNFTDDGFLDTESLPQGEFNAAEAIASILFARGYLCYCDPADEVIKAAQYPLDISTFTPANRWDCRELISFTVSRGTEEPVDRVQAEVQSYKPRARILRPSVDLTEELPPDTAADEVVDPNAIAVDVWPKTFPININGDEIRATRTEQRPAITSSTASYSYSENGKRSALFPTNPNDESLNYLTGTLVRRSHPRYKFAVSETRIEQVAKGVLSNEIFPEVETKAGRRVVKRWLVSNLGDGGDGVLSHEYEQLWLPRSIVLKDERLADDLEIQYEEGKRYQEFSPGQWMSVPYRLIADLDNLSTELISDPDFDGQIEFLDGVPAPPTHPEVETEELEASEAEANAESSGDSGGPILIVALPYGNRPSLARTVADVSLAMSQHNRIVYDVERVELAADTWAVCQREDAGVSAMVRLGHRLRLEVDDDGSRVIFGLVGWKAATLEKPITIPDADAGQLPSETNVTPVYTPIEVGRVNDDFAAPDEEITIADLASAVVNDDFAAPDETITIFEPVPATVNDDFAAPDEVITIFTPEIVEINDDFAAPDEEVRIGDLVTSTVNDDFAAPDEVIEADEVTEFWFDALDSSTITESGGVVSQIDDKSGNGANASQSVAASRPTLVQNVIGDKPGLLFDGVDDFLEFLTPTGMLANGAKTIYAVWQGVDGSGGFDFTMGTRYISGDNLNRGYIAIANTASGLAYSHIGIGGANATGYTDGDTAIGRYTVGADGSNPEIELDGTVQTLTANNLGPANAEFNNIPGGVATIIGRQGGAAGGFYLFELIGVLGDPDQPNHDKQIGRLAHKWGLESALPTNHPYKNAPPS
ncbi:MAG: hypothetical protein AAF773_00775 [Cyanobacteria bacterium P01_D01_bin.115]